jgi:hypothetical protein
MVGGASSQRHKSYMYQSRPTNISSVSQAIQTVAYSFQRVGSVELNAGSSSKAFIPAVVMVFGFNGCMPRMRSWGCGSIPKMPDNTYHRLVGILGC